MSANPGWATSEAVSSPAAANRFWSATANVMFASFDCAYATNGRKRSIRCRSSHRRRPTFCDRLVTVTIREFGAARRAGRIRPVNAKWPKWLVPSSSS